MRGGYNIQISILDEDGNAVGLVGGSEIGIFWDSHYSSEVFSTISGSALSAVFTGFSETFSLQIKDAYANLYNHKSHEAHLLSLTG